MGGYATQFLLLWKFDDLTLPMLACAGVLVFFVAIVRPLMGRKKDPLRRTTEQISLTQQRAVERDLAALIGQVTATAAEMTNQIEAQAVKLQALLKEADEKLHALRAACASGSPPSVPEEPVTAKAARSLAGDPRHVEVYDLADQGRSPREIARRLNRPHGEVELILALREAK